LELFEAAIGVARAANIAPTSMLPYQHANAVLRLGELERASRLHQENLSDAEAAGDTYGAAAVLFDLGLIALARSDLDRAGACCREALILVEKLGELLIGEFCLEALAVIAGIRGDARQVAVLLGAAERLCQRTGMPLPGVPGTERRLPVPGGFSARHQIENARLLLGDTAFAGARQSGSTSSLREVIAQTIRP
jgi:hypothetical protein